jgi:phage shock protein A
VGIFDRITSVFKGRASNALNKMESNNPEAVYEAAIIERHKQYQDMKKSTAELAVILKRSKEEFSEKQRKLAEIDPMVQIAVQSGEEEAALVLLEEKQLLTERLATLEPEIVNYQQQVEEMTAALRGFQGELEKLRREKEEMVSRKANAEAQLQIQDTLGSVSTQAQNQGLANVREQIERMAVDADLETTSARRVVTEKLSRSRAQAQLAALKQQMAGKGGAPAPAAAPAPASGDDAPAGEDAAGGEDESFQKRTL